MSTQTRHRVAIAAVFGIVFLARILTARGLSGDDHWSLWTASLFLHGDRPFRDFVDLGAPLYWAMSALAQAVVGYRPIGEVLLGTTLIAAALAISFHLAWQASRSLWIASATTAFALLFISTIELYSYQKIFFYPLGILLGWRYIDRPGWPRALALSIGVAVAFGYRHDHGAYLGVGAATAILAAHWSKGSRRVVLAWLQFGVVLFVLLLPFLVFVQINEGVVAYFHERIGFARRLDAGARVSVSLHVDTSAPPGWLPVDPPPPARVQIDWRADVTPETRTSLEQRYALTNGIHPKRQLFEYRLTDVSAANLSALLAEPAVAQIKGGIPAVIGLEWFASLTAEGREELERSYHLANPRRDPADRSGRMVLYDLLDISDANLGVLLADPYVVRSSGARVASPSATKAWPREGDSISIEWEPTLSDAAHLDLERKYGLEEAMPGRNRWEYALTDTSRANIQRIVDDPRVTDTGLIDRSTYRPAEEPWWVPIQRAVPLLRMRLAPQYVHERNGGVWLYYVSYVLPFLVLATLGFDRFRRASRNGMPHEAAKMFAAALMLVVANTALLRRLGYFADHVGTSAIVAAWLIGRTVGPMRVHPAVSRWTAAAATLVVVISIGAALAWAHPLSMLNDTGLTHGVSGAWSRVSQVFGVYAASPPIDGYAPPSSAGNKELLRYVYECTRPDDRVWIISDLMTFPYYTERRIVGHLYWDRPFMTSPDFQRRMLELINTNEVPLILGQTNRQHLVFLKAYPLLHEYAAKRYSNHYTVIEEGRTFRISTDNRRQPTGTYERLGLPCFK